MSLTQWTWIWANSGVQWKTGRPGVLWSMESQRVRYNLATKQQQQLINTYIFIWEAIPAWKLPALICVDKMYWKPHAFSLSSTVFKDMHNWRDCPIIPSNNDKTTGFCIACRGSCKNVATWNRSKAWKLQAEDKRTLFLPKPLLCASGSQLSALILSTVLQASFNLLNLYINFLSLNPPQTICIIF